MIGQAKTGVSSLELSRHLGVNYDKAWLLHNKILRAMTEREEAYLLRGKVQMDDVYLGGERTGGMAGRGSENKIPIVAAVSLNEAGHPIHARITAVSGFSSEAISDRAKRHLAPGSHVLSDRLAWFGAETKANCHPKDVVTGGKNSKELAQSCGSTLRCVNSRAACEVPSTFSDTAMRAFGYTKYPGTIWLTSASALTVASRWLG